MRFRIEFANVAFALCPQPTRRPTGFPTRRVPTFKPTVPPPTLRPTRIPTKQPTRSPTAIGFPPFVPDYLCTAKGKPCLFPFTYLGTQFTGCTLESDNKPWCATEIDKTNGGEVVEWGYCDKNCVRRMYAACLCLL